jgi:hypothetical protein
VRSESAADVAGTRGFYPNRQQTGIARFPDYQTDYDAALDTCREALDDDFESAWTAGASLSIDEAIAYAPPRTRHAQATQQRLGIADAHRSRGRA